jgi:hypothetical protein
MRRTVCLLAVVLLPLLSLGSDAPKGYDGETQNVGIDGVWLLVQTEEGGKVLSVKPNQICTYRAGTFHWSTRKDGAYSVDNRYRPARLTERVTLAPYTYRNIFRIDGDTLRIAYFLWLDDDYPGGFCGDGRELVVDTYKRVK